MCVKPTTLLLIFIYDDLSQLVLWQITEKRKIDSKRRNSDICWAWRDVILNKERKELKWNKEKIFCREGNLSIVEKFELGGQRLNKTRFHLWGKGKVVKLMIIWNLLFLRCHSMDPMLLSQLNLSWRQGKFSSSGSFLGDKCLFGSRPKDWLVSC